MGKDIKIKISGKEYKLLITLGFWKNLSFPRSEANSVYSNAKRLYEALKLAVYYGNKKERGWNSLQDMTLSINDDDFEGINIDPQELLGRAFMEYLPEEIKKQVMKEAEKILGKGNVKKN